jgi:hypothetical protein
MLQAVGVCEAATLCFYHAAFIPLQLLLLLLLLPPG